MQRVVVVLQPGPLGGRLERWEAARQETAERQVQAVRARFGVGGERVKGGRRRVRVLHRVVLHRLCSASASTAGSVYLGWY